MHFCRPAVKRRLLWLLLLIGLPAAAARAEVIFSTTNAIWRMWKGVSEASSPDPTAWRDVAFTDVSWSAAPAPFYYSSTATEPPFYNGGADSGTILGDMLNNYTCLFLRKTFVISNLAASNVTRIEVAGDDGFIVWLNGAEVGRTNMPAGPIPFNGRALGSIPEPTQVHVFTIAESSSWLREGTNVLCVQAFNWDPTSGDFGIMAGLSLIRDEMPPVVVSTEPPAGSSVAELTAIAVVFSEMVKNVDVEDLQINGLPANALTNFGSRFLFSFSQPMTGAVSVTWSPTHDIRDLGGNLFVGGSWSYQLDTNQIGEPIISEFMADNDGTLLDGLGEPSDWIEIHNPTASAVNLAGWKLRDSANTWSFPALVLPAGGYLVLFASGKLQQPYADAKGYLHTNFKLDADGEPLALLRPDDSVAWEYAIPASQKKGVSFGLLQTTTNLVSFETSARILIPTGAVSDAWRSNASFNDGSWLVGQASAGYGYSGGGTVAYRVHTATPGNQPIGESLGMDFIVNRDVVITELGCFDDNGDGLARTITTELWRRSDNNTPDNFGDDSGAGVLASMAFTPGNAGTLSEGSRFKSLTTPLMLTNGSYTIIAYGYGNGERAGNLGVSIPPDPWETQSGGGALSFVGFGRPGAPGTFPTTPDGGPPNRYAAGTFKFASPNDPLPRTSLPTMQNVNASSLLRVLFTVANPGIYESLLLRLAFDDGCVAWLNGVEVARFNAPPILAFNSTATQPTNDMRLIPLSANLLVSGMNVLAIQGLNVTANDNDFFMGATLTAIDTQTGNSRYFITSTPGAPNPSVGVIGYVADTRFSVKRGFYDAPFDLAITNATPGAQIRYTVDGSVPSETNGTIYTVPIHISSTAVVRAFAYKQGFQSANVDTHTYLFANDIALQPSSAPAGYPSNWPDYSNGGVYSADYGMIDAVAQPTNYSRAAGSAAFTLAEARAAISNSVKALPVISIVTDKGDLFDPTKGIYLHPAARGEAWERPASVELITTNGMEDWHANAGLHVMGLTSRRLDVTAKLNFMLVFSEQYGTPWLFEKFFGPDGPNRIKRIALRSNTRESWLREDAGFGTATYIVDGFAKESQLASGEPATRHRYSHVFLNGLYWGVYDATERPESHWAETTFGGEDEDYDVINLCCPNRIDAGDFTEWNQLLAAARAGLASDAAYQAIQGNFPDGTRNPALKRLLGVDSFIGFALNGYYHASQDWPDNFFTVYDNVADRTAGWRFVIWDTDLGFPNMDMAVNKVTPPEGVGTWASHDAPFAVDAALRQNAEYRMRFADRVYREFFHNGAYVTAANLARWQRLRDAIQPGMYAESARWGDYKPGGLRTVQDHWLPRVNGPAAMAWFNGRNAMVISQLRAAGLYPLLDPPEFNQHGGNVPAEFQLTITNSNGGGTTYFTLNGSDPRLSGGGLAPSALIYTQAVSLISPTLVRARVRNGATWSALNEAQFYPPQDFTKLQLSEIMYNPPKFGAVDGEEFEFLELKNSGTNVLELTGVAFTAGINFAFTNETIIRAGEYFVIGRNAAQFGARYPGAPLNGLYTGKLDNNGETLTLATTLGSTIFSMTYDNAAPWPAEADNSGLSLQRMSFAIGATNPMSWIAARPTPGASLPPEWLDNDGNGLPDAWEMLYSITDPAGDFDRDGLTNYEEFRAGTNPRDEDDSLRLQFISANFGLGSVNAVMSFQARSNKTYSIIYRASAHSDVWNKLLSVGSEATDCLVQVTNTFPSASNSYFFRLTTPRLP